MAYVPSQRVNVSNNIAVLNAIRNSASTYYQDYVPAVADASGVREIGVTIMQDIRLQNEFLQALINRIGRVNITSKIFQNPLRMFKKGVMEFGDTIEDIYVKDAYRGLGIGSHFLKFIESKYPNAILRLEVEAENERAVNVYQKCGFEVLPYMEMKK